MTTETTSKPSSILYSGFLPLNDTEDYNKAKSPQVIKWQDPSNWFDFEQVEKRAGYAGVLSEQAYIIDIDVEEHAQKVLEIIKAEGIDCEVRKTRKGVHIAFIRGSHLDTGKHNGWCTVIGLGSANGEGKTDYLAPNNKKRAYQALKVQGKERPIIYSTGKLGNCPPWLQPIIGNATQRKNRIGDASQFPSGNCRNDSLFRWMMELKIMGFQYAEACEVVRIINEYVFPESLDTEEMQLITRQEAWDNIQVRGRPKSNNAPTVSTGLEVFPIHEISRKPAYGVVADKLIEKFHIKRVMGSLHVYNDGAYIDMKTSEGKRIIDYDLETTYEGMNNFTVKETFGSLERRSPKDVPMAHPAYIAFKNGIYNMRTRQLEPHNPDIVVTNLIPHNYIEDARNDVLDKFLRDITGNDIEVEMLLSEITGYCFYRDLPFRESLVFLVGGKGCGKSTFLDLLKYTIGENNCSNVDPKYFGDDENRFRRIELKGKLANVPDDISDKYIADPSALKKAAVGNTTSAENKGKDSEDFKPYATNVFSANKMPAIKDDGDAITSRMTIVPFDQQFHGTDKENPFMKDELLTESVAEAFIASAIAGLHRMMDDNRGFTVPEKCKKMKENYALENDSVRYFLKDLEDEEDVTPENHSTKFIYLKYQMFCSNHGMKALGSINFNKRVCELTGLSVDSRNVKARVDGYITPVPIFFYNRN